MKRFVCQHIGIFIEDLEKMTRFYVKELGFKLERDYTADKTMMRDIFKINSPARIRYLSLNDFGIELFYFKEASLSHRNTKTSGYNHWTLFVKDKVSFCRRLAKKGFKVIQIIKPHGFTFFIQDPEGNLIEVKSYAL